MQKTQNNQQTRHFEQISRYIGGIQYEAKDGKGNTVLLDFHKVEGNPKNRHFLGNLWAKSGYIEKPISSYWSLSVYVTDDITGECRSGEAYNLTHVDFKIGPEGMKEATEEQFQKILSHAEKVLNKSFEDMAAPGFDFGSFDSLDDLTGRQYKAAIEKAKRCAKRENLFIFYNWDKQACFITSGSLHGFYFPNREGALRCIAFRKGRAVAVYDTEGIR